MFVTPLLICPGVSSSVWGWIILGRVELSHAMQGVHGAAVGRVVRGSLASAHVMPHDSHPTCVTPPSVPRRCQPSCQGANLPPISNPQDGAAAGGDGGIIFANKVTTRD